MKFVVDCMLGKLAKWLRILGFDVAYFNKAEDGKLLSLARKEGRVLLTRDHRLRAEARDIQALLIESENWKKQLKQVLEEFQLKREVKPYSRCIQCNVELKSLSKRAAKNLVSPFVYEQAAAFAICPGCGRVFWQGTHFEDMDSKIGQILGRSKASTAAARKRRPGPAK